VLNFVFILFFICIFCVVMPAANNFSGFFARVFAQGLILAIKSLRVTSNAGPKLSILRDVRELML
jgi:hypothetical protein